MVGRQRGDLREVPFWSLSSLLIGLELAKPGGVGGAHQARRSSAPDVREDMTLRHFERSQQVPNPPGPEPGNPPGTMPPPPPEIPVPDPAPPPVENPGDVPLPPITDPDVVNPGEPRPGQMPTRVESIEQILNESMIGGSLDGEIRSNPNRNLSADLELENIMETCECFAPAIGRGAASACQRRNHPQMENRDGEH